MLSTTLCYQLCTRYLVRMTLVHIATAARTCGTQIFRNSARVFVSELLCDTGTGYYQLCSTRSLSEPTPSQKVRGFRLDENTMNFCMVRYVIPVQQCSRMIPILLLQLCDVYAYCCTNINQTKRKPRPKLKNGKKKRTPNTLKPQFFNMRTTTKQNKIQKNQHSKLSASFQRHTACSLGGSSSAAVLVVS